MEALIQQAGKWREVGPFKRRFDAGVEPENERVSPFSWLQLQSCGAHSIKWLRRAGRELAGNVWFWCLFRW